MHPRKHKPTSAEQAAEQHLMEILKTALSFFLPENDAQRAVNGIALHMGSLSATLRAPEDALAKVPGVGPETARYLKCCIELAKAYLESSASTMKFIIGPESEEELFRPLFLDKAEEHVALALLGVESQLLFCGLVGNGGLSSAPLNVREMLTLALNYDARYAILAHNHTSGIAAPSDDDVLSTGVLLSAFGSLGVTLKDHIVLTKDHMFSFAECGLLKTLFIEDQQARRSLIEDARTILRRREQAAGEGADPFEG